MGMPNIPEGKFRPNEKEVIIDLFESIALEEMALSHIINAEGEKTQEIVQKYKKHQIDECDLIKLSNSTNQVITNLIIKEWLLLTKFNSVKDYSEIINQKSKNKKCDNNYCEDESYDKCKKQILELCKTINSNCCECCGRNYEI